MNIHLARDGSALGIFTADEVRAGLESGRFRRDDLAWREGMPAWTPLSAWPEFDAAGVPAAQPSAVASAPSELPWEQSPGLKSLLRSAWLLLARPAVLTNARLQAGQVFSAAYLAIGLLFVPMLLLAPLNTATEQARTEYIGEVLAASGNPQLAEVGRKMVEEVQHQADAGVGVAVCAAGCVMLVYPLIAALVGIMLWPGLRIQGKKVPFGRVITAAIFTSCLLFLALFPATLVLTVCSYVAPIAMLPPAFAFMFVAFGLGCRSMGPALGLSGWRVFLAWVLLGSVFCVACCCCCGVGGFLGALAGGR